MVDTNSDPRPIDFVIPSNDDASKSIEIIMSKVTDAVAEGLAERKSEKQAEKAAEESAEAGAAKEVQEQPKEEAKAEPVVEKAPKKEVKADKKVEAAPAVEEKATVEKTSKKPAAKDPDNLTKIEGIGPKAAEALVAAGVDTYDKLAGSKAENIKEILTEASSRMAHLDPTSWPKQARMAADGKWDALKEWQDKAKAGVE
jgi:small subunit ribosomal protein S2